MRKIAIALAAGAALLAGPALQARERLTGEEQLAKMLEGRVAGEPVSCIPLHRTSKSRIIDRTAIVYDSGRTIYVNRPRNPESLEFGRHHGHPPAHQPALPAGHGAAA